MSVHIILAIGQVTNLVVTTWLAQTRRRADRERRRFYIHMQQKHGIPLNESQRAEAKRSDFVGQ